jgi:hypothetical protein
VSLAIAEFELVHRPTPADRIRAAVAVCTDATVLSDEATYFGAMDLGAPSIPHAILDEFVFYKEVCAGPSAIAAVDTTLDAEFLTNLRLVDGTLSTVTVKYIGMQPNFSMESVVQADHKPDSFLVDFIFNVLKLELVTPAQIETFLTQELYPNVTGYLLSSEQVDVLLERGEHEFFNEEAIQDARNLVAEIVALHKKKFGVQ